MINNSYIVLDLETVPDTMPDDLKPSCALGNLVDPVKIAAKQKEWGEDGQVKRMSLSPAMNKIVSLQMWWDDCLIDFKGDEVGKLCDFWNVLSGVHGPPPDLIVGYNLINFDLPTILMRSMLLGIKPSRELPLRKYSKEPIFDVMQELAYWNPENWKGLDWWAKRLGVGETIGSGADIYKLWKDGKQEEIDTHCRRDVELTRDIYERIRG